MNPWWLRPPADEATDEPRKDRPADRGTADPSNSDRVSPSSTAPEGGQEPATRERKDGSGTRRSGAGRSGTDRRRGGKRASSRSSPALDTQTPNSERRIAIFCDLENIALGVRDSDTRRFDLALILERLLEKGKIIVKKAYGDWERYSDYKSSFHGAGVELIDIPQKYHSGKNSAEIKLAVDAIELCYSREHLDTFVIISGDGDLSPLVSKLKENNKLVIGVGVKKSASKVLIENCDEFLFYEDIWSEPRPAPALDGIENGKAEAFELMILAIQALLRENKEVLWGSMIKQTMQRKRPSFSEGHYGYSGFSELLEDAERHRLIELERDERSGSYIVTTLARR